MHLPPLKGGALRRSEFLNSEAKHGGLPALLEEIVPSTTAIMGGVQTTRPAPY